MIPVKKEGALVLPPPPPYQQTAKYFTAKNTVISPDFLVWKVCGKAQFPHSFGRFALLIDRILSFLEVAFEINKHRTPLMLQLHCESDFFITFEIAKTMCTKNHVLLIMIKLLNKLQQWYWIVFKNRTKVFRI